MLGLEGAAGRRVVRAPLRPRRRLAGGRRAEDRGGVLDRSGLHRVGRGARAGLGAAGADREDFRGTLGGIGTEGTPRRVTFCFGAGDSPASSLAPPPLFRVRAFSGPGNPASWPRVAREGRRVLELGPSGDWTLPGGAANPRASSGRPLRGSGGGRKGMGPRGPSPRIRGKPRLQKLDALAGRSLRSGRRSSMRTPLAP